MNNKIEEIRRDIDYEVARDRDLGITRTDRAVTLRLDLIAEILLATLGRDLGKGEDVPKARLCSCPDHAAKPTKGRDFYFCANCGYRLLAMEAEIRGFGARGDVDVQKSPNVVFSREAWDDLVLAVRQASNTLFNLKQIGLTRAIIPSEASSMGELQERLDKLLRDMRQ